ncbi:MAG: hypothetical protein R3D84_17895 [Paracoccaceae bacterium]
MQTIRELMADFPRLDVTFVPDTDPAIFFKEWPLALDRLMALLPSRQRPAEIFLPLTPDRVCAGRAAPYAEPIPCGDFSSKTFSVGTAGPECGPAALSPYSSR